MRGRTMSLFMTATWGGWRIGALPVGFVAGAWSASLAVGLAAVALLATLVPAARNRALWAIDARGDASPVPAPAPAAQDDTSSSPATVSNA